MNLDLNLVENLTDKNTSRMHAFALLQLQRIDSQICKNSKPLKVKVEVFTEPSSSTSTSEKFMIQYQRQTDWHLPIIDSTVFNLFTFPA